jgi:hypothetical protein
MQKQSSGVPLYLALILAILAAISSMQAKGAGAGTKLISLLTVEAAADAAQMGGDELQTLGLP